MVGCCFELSWLIILSLCSFTDDREKTAKIVYTTDSSLLQVWGEDRALTKYSHIVVDEAHERSLSTDLILAVMKTTMTDAEGLRDTPLHIVITSATIEPDLFVKYFEEFSVNVIHVPGRYHGRDQYH